MAFSCEQVSGKYFLAFPEMRKFLEDELNRRFQIDIQKIEWHGDLAFVPESDFATPYFCCCGLTEPFLAHFDSIGEAAKLLKNIQRNWASSQFNFFRRASLISEKLPYINTKPKKFPWTVPAHNGKVPQVGLFTLLDEHTLVASARTTSFLPAGKIEFEEDHENPPSRAYLKLWEALTEMNVLFGVGFPQAGEKCFDAGACPGGWTWVMTGCGCNVLAVDRSELAPALMQNKLVTFRAHDAFTIETGEVGECDWVLSDVICYPERLYDWVCKWILSGLARRMICTIKMQGAIDWKIVDKFAALPNSAVLHLNYNKHELTFLYVRERSN